MLNGLRGIDANDAAIVQAFNPAFGIGGQAIETVVMGENIVDSGRAQDLDIGEVAAHDPPANQNLLIHIKERLPGHEARIRTSIGQVDIDLGNVDGPRVHGHPIIGSLYIAPDEQLVAEKRELIFERRVDVAGLRRGFDYKGVEGIADDNAVAAIGPTDGHLAEAIAQSGHVAHGHL